MGRIILFHFCYRINDIHMKKWITIKNMSIPLIKLYITKKKLWIEKRAMSLLPRQKRAHAHRDPFNLTVLNELTSHKWSWSLNWYTHVKQTRMLQIFLPHNRICRRTIARMRTCGCVCVCDVRAVMHWPAGAGVVCESRRAHGECAKRKSHQCCLFVCSPACRLSIIQR